MNATADLITLKEGWEVDPKNIVQYQLHRQRLKLTMRTTHGEHSVYLEGDAAARHYALLRSDFPQMEGQGSLMSAAHA